MGKVRNLKYCQHCGMELYKNTTVSGIYTDLTCLTTGCYGEAEEHVPLEDENPYRQMGPNYYRESDDNE